jgi:hypothetical protein
VIRVTVEMENPLTREVTKIAQMHIWHRGDGTNDEGAYRIAVCDPNFMNVPSGYAPTVTEREGMLDHYSARSVDIWRFIRLALARVTYGEVN